MNKRIVILGGGSGGVVAADYLATYLGGTEHSITLVNRTPNHVYQPSNLWIMMGWRKPSQATRPLSRLASRGRRIDVRIDEVVGIDTSNRSVELGHGHLPYDYLIISLGLETLPDAVPGAHGEAEHPWEQDAAEHLRQRLANFHRGRLLVGIAGAPYRCPPAPYETSWLIDAELRKRGVRQQVEMTFFSPEPDAFGGGKVVSPWTAERLKTRNITTSWNFMPQAVDPARHVVRAEDGRELPYDLLIMVPKHAPARPLVDSGIAGPKGIDVEPATLATQWEGVYAIGDNTSIPFASKSGGIAHEEAETVASNIAAEITGHRNLMRRFEPHSI